MYYTKDASSGKLTVYSNQDDARNASRNPGCAGWGSLVVTPYTPVPAHRETPDEPGHGTWCSCRACQMKYHGGW